MESLPRKLKKKEALKTPAIMDWFVQNYPHSVAVEVKIKGNKVKPHQNAALEQIVYSKFKYKLPDMGRQNPFDFVVLKEDTHAIIVVYDEGLCTAYCKNNKNIFIFNV